MFFFKQKTAYEMRISDWSSDVCSSDLDALVIIAFEPPEQIALVRQEQRAFGFEPVRRESFEADRRIAAVWPLAQILPHAGLKVEIGADRPARSEEHTSELQSLMRISYRVFCRKHNKKNSKKLTLHGT